jgi:hypothetical protein
MKRCILPVFPLMTAALAIVGCSAQTWYEGVKVNARSECYRQPLGETENCLGRVNTMSYEEYERNRRGSRQ